MSSALQRLVLMKTGSLIETKCIFQEVYAQFIKMSLSSVLFPGYNIGKILVKIRLLPLTCSYSHLL